MKPFATDIIQHVADVFEVSKADITGRRHQRILARPRQAACYLIREITGKSFPAIGNVLGGRDHSTIMHNYEVCIDIMRCDPVFKAKVLHVRDLVHKQKELGKTLPTVRAIIEAASHLSGVSVETICGYGGRYKLAPLRAVIVEVAAQYRGSDGLRGRFSDPAIGKALGGRSYSTIAHLRYKAPYYIEKNPKLAELMTALQAEINRRSVRVVDIAPIIKAKNDFTLKPDVFNEMDDLSRRVAEHYGRHM